MFKKRVWESNEKKRVWEIHESWCVTEGVEAKGIVDES